MKKILLSVAPVCHETVTVPKGAKVPYTPEEVAREVIACAGLGTGMVHLHVRNEKGEQTADLSHFSRTIDLIRKESDIIIQGSTGGVAELSLEERCVSLKDPRVKVASLNMGSANLGEGVYINTLPPGSHWGIIHEDMADLSLLATAAGMGASSLRYGFEDSFMLGEGRMARTNMEIAEKLIRLLEWMDLEPMTPSEARTMIGINA